MASIPKTTRNASNIQNRSPKSGVRIAGNFVKSICCQFLLNQECTSSDGEEGATLNESRGQNHLCEDLSGSLRLAGNSVNGAATNLTNTNTCTNNGNTSSNTAAQLSQTFG